MFKLVYHPNNTEQELCVPDCEAEQVALYLKFSHVATNSELVVLAALALVSEGELNINEVEFYYYNIKVTVLEDGRTVDAPEEFGGYYGSKFCERIIKGGLKVRQKKRNAEL